MEKLENIEIRIVGKEGNNDLSPKNYDIKQLGSLLRNVEDLLFPNKKQIRPIVSYDIQKGSVKHLFYSSMQTVITFSAILARVVEISSIDDLDLKTSRAFEAIQKTAVEKNYEFQISTSFSNTKLKITPFTNFYKTENILVDAEFYFYGIIKDAGGKGKANIHLDTKDYGYLTIETEKDFLEEQKENLLYKSFGVRTIGKQDIYTGEIDTKSLKLIEFIDYQPKLEEDYLNKLIANASKNWQGVDVDEWLLNVRGNYEASPMTQSYLPKLI